MKTYNEKYIPQKGKNSFTHKYPILNLLKILKISFYQLVIKKLPRFFNIKITYAISPHIHSIRATCNACQQILYDLKF